ncbi:unnamed protein product [Dibothriocephalus latus]|uniref:Uncharacterized protein n=1 Tax=Dibothriocephalus latus TaxID=60516 RepID=A0A3P7LSN5_DIBLA|nr:unnamed protein product [Dibothriocephalus latus]
MALNLRLRKVTLISALTVVACIYITYRCIYKADYDDFDRSLVEKVGEQVETPADFDGTASSCRCQAVHRRNRTRFWPPLDVQDLFCSRDGTYDISLCVDQLDNASTYHRNKLTERLRMLRAQNPDVKVTGSELNQWYQLEDSSRRQRYDMYPMAVNISETNRNMSLGLPVLEVRHSTLKRFFYYLLMGIVLLETPSHQHEISSLREAYWICVFHFLVNCPIFFCFLFRGC